MKYLICGCNGMAGHTIMLYLKSKGHKVDGLDKEKSKIFDNLVVNVFDQDKVKEIILNGNYDIVINCIGILNQAAEDNKSLAIYLNSYFPHFLASITKNLKTRIFHMSTDCVFSGNKGQYAENDFKDGDTYYDRTKALGELDDCKNVTFRNSIVGPDLNPNGIGLFNWFMHQNSDIKGFKKVLWTGQTTLQLAKTMEQASYSNVTGLFNMVPSQPISKYDLLQLFNKYMRDSKININVDEINICDKSLIRTNYSWDFIVPDYEQMVKEMADWIDDHKEFYKHYWS